MAWFNVVKLAEMLLQSVSGKAYSIALNRGFSMIKLSVSPLILMCLLTISCDVSHNSINAESKQNMLIVDQAIDRLLDPSLAETDAGIQNLKRMQPYLDIIVDHQEYSEGRLIELFCRSNSTREKQQILGLLTWTGKKPTLSFVVNQLDNKSATKNYGLLHNALLLLAVLTFEFPDETGQYTYKFSLTQTEIQLIRTRVSHISACTEFSDEENSEVLEMKAALLDRLTEREKQ